jgi:plastocyanin
MHFKIISALLVAAMALPAWAGDIKGTIKYTGAAAKPAPLKVTKDNATCGATVEDESMQVTGTALKNVVVMVKGVAGAAPTPKPITVDQQKCHYIPHVQAAAKGSTVDILNNDPILHNVHGYLGTATVFNLAMPLKGQKIPKKLDKAGVVRLKCDVHSWMTAYIVVHDNPFFTQSNDGSFTIPGVPAGTYTVTAWHEKLGEKTAQVTVPATGEVTTEFSFGDTKS